MTGSPETSPIDSDPRELDAEQGWYLYCVTRSGVTLDALPEPEVEVWPAAGPLEVANRGALAAVGRRVPLADFDPETVRARAEDPGWLEAVARMHNEVIEAVHAKQAVLPAAFGSVYPRREDVLDSLEQSREMLVEELARLEDCDEWALHVHANRERVRDGLARTYPGVEQIERDLAEAGPGRAYFLQRKLDEEVARATDAALADLAQESYDRLLRQARDADVGSPRRAAEVGEVEILHAAFLVPRTATASFLTEVEALIEDEKGLRAECSGPWPPYSFAVRPEEVTP